MCNPRRLEVNLTQQIEEEWQETVEENATVNLDVEECLERTIHLGDRLGPSAREALSAALREGFRNWQAVDGEDERYERDVGSLHLRLDARSADLTVAVRHAASVTRTATAQAEFTTHVHGTAEATATGNVHDDGWQGLTEDNVRPEVEQRAEQALHGDRERIIQEQTRKDRKNASRHAEAEAQRQAAEAAEEEAAEERERLRAEIEETFRRSTPILHEEVSALVGETMRRGVLHLVKVNGGELRRCEENDDVIEIEAVL